VSEPFQFGNNLTRLMMLSRMGVVEIRLEDGYLMVTQGCDAPAGFSTGITQEECESLDID
jgi:hypothetical protein